MRLECKFQNLREFDQTFAKYARLSGKDEKEIVLHRSTRMAHELYRQFRKIAPKASVIKALPKKLGYRIKRKPGVSIKSEIQRRVNSIGAAASGWLPAVRRLRGSGTNKKIALVKIRNPRGHVEMNLREPSVTLVNSMKEAAAAEARHHVMGKAVAAQVLDMQRYINRKLMQRAKQFSVF